MSLFYGCGCAWLNPSTWEVESGGFVSSKSARGYIVKPSQETKQTLKGGAGAMDQGLKVLAAKASLDVNSIPGIPVVEAES